MRLLFFFSFILFSSYTIAQDLSFDESEIQENVPKSTDLKWFTNLDEAKNEAKKTKKPILVYFTGSDWCTPCKKLEKYFFETSEFVKQSTQYHLVYLDNPYRDDIIPETAKKANKKLSSKFNAKIPTILALDCNGRERNRVERFSGEDPRYHWRFMKENQSIFNL